MKKLSKEAQTIEYRKKRLVEAIECDKCKRIIKPTIYNEESSKYFTVTTGHRDWGNDSCESIEHFDICPHCIDKFVSRYLQECPYTGYIEIETEFINTGEYEYD